MTNAPQHGAAAPQGVGAGRFAGSLPRMVAGLAVVLLAAVLSLAIANAIPAIVSGQPRGVMSVGTIDAAERQLRARIWTPAYFPDSLRWPPATVSIYPGPPAAVALTFAGADGSTVRLVLCQTIDAPEGIPAKLLPPGLMLESARTSVGATPATLMRVELPDGRLVHELLWDLSGRTLALRFDGPLDQLMLLARSLDSDR